VLGFTGIVIAFLQVKAFPIGSGWNWPLSIVCGLALGAAIGAFQGYWVAYRGVPAFVVTLGGLLIFRGATFMVTSGQTVAPLDPTYELLGGGLDGSIGALWSWILGLIAVVCVVVGAVRSRAKRRRFDFPQKPIWAEAGLALLWSVLILGFVAIMNAYAKPGTNEARGIPIPVLILIAVVLVMTLLSRITRFGRYVFAMGGNPEAAQLSGINVRKTTLTIFVTMGILAAIAAVVQTARLNAATNSLGQLVELSVIAAAVIGGTSLAGGMGTIPGAILGAVIMQSLENGMVLLSVSSATRQVVIGAVLIAAVWFDVAYNKRRR
jgi:D-xylose transport system permease protein